MSKLEKIKKILILASFVIIFSCNSVARAQNTSLSQDDSIYKYNALENKANFLNITDNTDDVDEKLPEDIVLIDNNIKKLDDITKQQIISIQKSEEVMDTINNMGMLRTFIIGNKLGILKFQMVQMQNQSYVLEIIALETTDTAIKDTINSQIQILKEEQKKVESFILERDSKFSLFGWLIASL